MPCFIPETLHDILRYCNRLQLCRILPTNRQFNQIIRRYFHDAPFISFNKLIVNVNSLNSCPEIYLSFENAAGEHVSKRISGNMEQDFGAAIVRAIFPNQNTEGVAPEFLRAQNVLFTFNNSITVNEKSFRILENLSVIASNSFLCILLSGFNSNKVGSFDKLLSVVAKKCQRLRLDFPWTEDIPLLVYPALYQFNQLEIDTFSYRYLNQNDIVEFLHPEPESQRQSSIRLRILFPDDRWANELMESVIKRFDQSTEVSQAFQLQFCLHTTNMSFKPFVLKNPQTFEVMRYYVGREEEEFIDTLLHTIERHSE